MAGSMGWISRESAGASFRGIDFVYIIPTVSALTGYTTKEGHTGLDALLKASRLVFGAGAPKPVTRTPPCGCIEYICVATGVVPLGEVIQHVLPRV